MLVLLALIAAPFLSYFVFPGWGFPAGMLTALGICVLSEASSRSHF